MKPKKQISINRVKVCLVVLLCMVLLSLPVLFINNRWLHLHKLFAFFVILLPLLCLLIGIIKAGGPKNLLKTLTLTKYWRHFPSILFYDPQPYRYRFKNRELLQSDLQEGDILLRRFDHYVDGLILKQTSYFTHAGMYFGSINGKDRQVIHAVGVTGVSFIDLDDFVKCDDILVLRMKDISFHDGADIPSPAEQKIDLTISFIPQALSNLLLKQDKNGSGAWGNKPIELKDARTFITGKETDLSRLSELARKELAIYDQLNNNIPVDRATYVPVIKEAGLSVLGEAYDYDFNFVDFTKMSCVEFVWYAYKCLLPVHRIKRNFYNYFAFVKTFVIVPDDFLKSDAFDLVFSSLPIGDKAAHVAFVCNKKFLFWSFLLRVVLVQMTLLLFIFIALHYFFMPG